MKLRYLFAALALSFAFVGCAKEIEETGGESGNNADPYADGTKLSLSLRYMVTAAENSISAYQPLVWPEDATVCVNGKYMARTSKVYADSTLAEFGSVEKIAGPYYVTSPYSDASTAESPKVVFPPLHVCLAGGPDFATLPFCGYSNNNKLMLRHLAGAFCMPVKSSAGQVRITKVTFTSDSGSKLAGEWDVDCVNATATASAAATSSVNYMYPEGEVASPERDGTLYMSLPAGDHGECTMVIYDSAGGSMQVRLMDASLKAGAVTMLDAVEYVAGSSVIASMPGAGKASGYVKDTAGNPIQGVAVTDGFTVVTTDANGYYSIGSVSTDTWHIYYCTPAGYEIAVNEFGQPCFWEKYVPGVSRYDFTLTPIAGGKENKFALFTYADPQVYSNNNLNRFLKEAVPGIKAHASTFNIPLYGMGLGDIVFNTDNQKSSHQMDDMRAGFSVSSVGMPVFQVMGNHDQVEYDANNPLQLDARNSDVNIRAQRDFHEIFGPTDYSFDRADAHIIGMCNIMFSSATTSGTNYYHGGFTDRQYEWLKQDLALVPKDKLVILCVHKPIYDCKDETIGALKTHTNISNVMNLLDQYENVRILSGHVHTQRTYVHKNGIIEHNSASLAGAWWNMCVSADGCPNGFNVYTIQGNDIVDGYYFGYTASSSKRNHQMRLHRGNSVTGGPKPDPDQNYMGYYAFNFDEDVVLANVYNADVDWVISVYEDGVYSGDMTLLDYKQPSFATLVGDRTYENPLRIADGVESGHDMWVTGYFMGVMGRASTANGGWKECYHMYKYKLKNKDAQVKVVAKDRYGNTYEETVFTEGTDVSAAVKP